MTISIGTAKEPFQNNVMDILIVDDTALNLVLMEKLATRTPGRRIHAFSHSVKALEWCARHELDLIIVDYMMPEVDGLEFIRRVRSWRRHDDVPVLMVTANNERTVRYQALELGANDFLNKPIDVHEFEPRVRNMLKLREAHLSTRLRAEALADAVREATAEILARERETIMRLARAAEFRDPDTGTHIQRMSHYSAVIARRLGCDENYIETIFLAAPMHDVGKLGIPDHILLKRGPLTPEEQAVMRRHPIIGHDILKGSSSNVVELGAIIALTHHEKFNGSGYPQQLAGDVIPLAGRIVAVADVFDALTSNRAYKTGWPMEEAAAFLRRGSSIHFDPDCVDALLSEWDEISAIRDRFHEQPDPPQDPDDPFIDR